MVGSDFLVFQATGMGQGLGRLLHLIYRESQWMSRLIRNESLNLLPF